MGGEKVGSPPYHRNTHITRRNDMAFKLSKKEKNDKADLIERLGEKHATIESAAASKDLDDTNSAIDAYNEVLDEANAFVEEIANRLRDEYDGKSEKWQESEAGTDALAFISDWEELSLDRVARLEADDNFEVPSEEAVEALENLGDGE